MKNSLFWKIIAVAFLLWLFLWIFSNRYYYIGSGFYKINKFTGRLYEYSAEEIGWKRVAFTSIPQPQLQPSEDPFAFIEQLAPKKKEEPKK